MTFSQRAVEAALDIYYRDHASLPDRKWMEFALTAALAVDGVALQGWQPIKSAPRDGTEIIYLNKFGEIGFCYWSEAVSQFDESLWYDDQADDECCPLYWLPRSHLPPPPAASDGEEWK